MPRARIAAGDGRPVEWKSKALRAYQRRTKAADARIASTYLAGTPASPKHACSTPLTAAAVNLVRVTEWFASTPVAKTRCSRFATLQLEA